MTTAHSNKDSGSDAYQVYRHLFRAAQLGAPGWSLFATYTAPQENVVTEYQHDGTGDRIKADSWDWDGEKFANHLFTFKQGSDE